jgi:methyl-accepting chemotaxis protein
MIILTGGALLIAGAMAFWNIRSVHPLRLITVNMLKLARGDLSIVVSPVDSRNEVCEITTPSRFSRTTWSKRSICALVRKR